jgi:hypothetical protein
VKLVFPWNPTNLPDCGFVGDGARVHEEDFIANPILYKTTPISCLVFRGFRHGEDVHQGLNNMLPASWMLQKFSSLRRKPPLVSVLSSAPSPTQA